MRARSSGEANGVESAPDGLVADVTTEVVVAAGAFRDGHGLHFAGVGSQFDDALGGEVARLERGLAAVEAAGVDRFEGEVEATQVLLPGRRSEIDSARDLVRAVDNAGEGADYDVGDALALSAARVP